MRSFTGGRNTFSTIELAGIIFAILFLIPVVNPPVLCSAVPPKHLSSKSIDYILFEQKILSFLPDNAKWSLCAVDINTGKTIISSDNAGKSLLIPGSVIKLFLTALVLETGITSTDFDTSIAFYGVVADEELKGDIYIRGSGNALLSSKDINFAVQKIRSLGIKVISGDIILDDSCFDTHGFTNKTDSPAYATPAAFGMDLHTISITVNENAENIIAIPPNNGLKFYFNNSKKPSIRRINDLSYEISMNPANPKIIRKRFSLSDPGLYAAGVFKTILKQNGIITSGSIKRGVVPSCATEIVCLKSMDIDVMLKEMNKYSLNVLADNILLSIGAKKADTQGSADKGVAALKDFLSRLGIRAEEINLFDGSGLSRHNGITAVQMTDFLVKITKKKWFSSFYDTVPSIGINGEIVDTLSGIQTLKLKTGRLPDVFSIAGYIDYNGRQTAMAYIVNVPGADLLTVSDFTKAVYQVLLGKITQKGEL